MNKVNKIITSVIILLFIESIFLAFWHDTYIEVFAIALPSAFVPLWLLKNIPQATLTKHACSFSLMVFACLHIHQTYGLIEVHFEIFILMAVLIIFQDWKVFISAVSVIALHHLSFYFLQKNGADVYLFTEDRLMFSAVMIHAIYAVVEAVITGIIAKMLYDENRIANELSRVTNDIVGDSESLDLKPRTFCHGNVVLNGFNQLLSMLENVVGIVKKQSHECISNVANLLTAKNELTRSAKQRQQETENIATAAEEMSATVASISKNTAELSGHMKQATQSTEAVNVHIKEINTQNNELTESLHKTSEEITTLANSSNLIVNILSEITSIADQTNLLALNAAIEAARAGEQGRGFAVVANEVRTLANRTKESTEKVNTTLDLLVSHSQSSTKSMGNCIEAVGRVISVSELANKEITNASQIVSLSNDVAHSVAAAVEQQLVTTNEIAQSIDNINLLSRDDLLKIDVLGEEADNISNSAASLEASIARFK